MLNILLGIVGVVLIIIGVLLKFIRKRKYGKICFPILSVLLGILIVVLSASFTIIPTGFTGVKSTLGQIDNVTMANGLNWKLPFVQSIETVNNKQQDIKFEDDIICSETEERTAIQYKGIIVSYQIASDKSAWIYANISDYKSNLITNSLVASSIKSASKSLSDTDATNRSIIEALAAEKIQKSLNEKYGNDVIYINKVVINNADFEDSYNDAIARKQEAQLAKEQQDIVNQQNIDKAEADAEALKIKTEGEAEAVKIKAEAEAEANEKLSKSLTDNVIKDKYYDKWNGELPKVVSDNGLLFDLDLNSESNDD